MGPDIENLHEQRKQLATIKNSSHVPKPQILITGHLKDRFMEQVL